MWTSLILTSAFENIIVLVRSDFIKLFLITESNYVTLLKILKKKKSI